MILIAFALAYAVPFAITYLAFGRVTAQPALRIGLACGGALAIPSVLFSLGLYLYPPVALRLDVAAELALLFALLFWQRRTVGHAVSTEKSAVFAVHPLLKCLVIGAATFALLLFIADSHDMPHGQWDAWGSWNLKARFFARATERWRASFDPKIGHTHANYPLLLQAGVARTMKLLRSDSTWIPQLYAFSFTVGAVLTAAAAIAKLRGASMACLCACLLLLGPTVHYGTAQYADVPLSLFFVAAAAFLALADADVSNRRPFLFSAGVAIGLAMWTKNEGQLFAVAMVVGRGVRFFSNRSRAVRDIAWMLAGMLPLVALVAWHRHIAPRDDFGTLWNLKLALGYIASFDRIAMTARAFFDQLLAIFPWLPLLIGIALFAGGARRSSNLLSAIAVCVMMFGGYFFVLLTTPLDLKWHLTTTVDRLMTQLYPLFVFTLFLGLPTPEELAETLSAPRPVR